MGTQAEDVKRIIPSTGEPHIDARAVIKHVLPPTDPNDAGTKEYVDAVGSSSISTLTNQFASICDDNNVLREDGGEVDAHDGIVINVGDATLTRQHDAINYKTLTSQFPMLLTNNNAAIVSSLESSASEIAPITLSTLTCQTNDIASVNAKLSSLGTLINSLEAAIAAQGVITQP